MYTRDKKKNKKKNMTWTTSMDRIYLQFAQSGKFSLSVSLSHARTLFLVVYSGSIIRFFSPRIRNRLYNKRACSLSYYSCFIITVTRLFFFRLTRVWATVPCFRDLLVAEYGGNLKYSRRKAFIYYFIRTVHLFIYFRPKNALEDELTSSRWRRENGGSRMRVREHYIATYYVMG